MPGYHVICSSARLPSLHAQSGTPAYHLHLFSNYHILPAVFPSCQMPIPRLSSIPSQSLTKLIIWKPPDMLFIYFPLSCFPNTRTMIFFLLDSCFSFFRKYHLFVSINLGQIIKIKGASGSKKGSIRAIHRAFHIFARCSVSWIQYIHVNPPDSSPHYEVIVN